MAVVTVCPAYGDGAMLGSLLMVEACSEAEREAGEVVLEVDDPPEQSVDMLYSYLFYLYN